MTKKNKKAQFVEIDFFLAILILALGLAVVTAPFINTKEDIQSDRLSHDAVQLLTTMKLQDFNTTLKNNIQGNATNLDVDLNLDDTITTMLTKIYVKENETTNTDNKNKLVELAKNITQLVLDDLIPRRYKYEVTIFSGTETKEIINISDDEKTTLATQSRTLLTGLEVGKPITGYIATANLKEVKTKDATYEFIGGFIGQGILEFKLEIPQNAGDITNFTIEGLFRDNFTVELNEKGICDNIEVTDFVQKELNSNCKSNLTKGENNITINFTGSDLQNKYVSGGIIQAEYEIDQTPITNAQTTITKRKNIPGVDGIINIYDSIYVPGELQNIKLVLNHDVNITYKENIDKDDDVHISAPELIINLGNETIYKSNESGPIYYINNSINLENNYENQTIPYRMGFPDLSALIETTKPTDVILVTDISGSMGAKSYNGLDMVLDEDFGEDFQINTSETCWGLNDTYDDKTFRIHVARCLNFEFVEQLSENDNINIGLVNYASQVFYNETIDGETYTHYLNLTNDKNTLFNFINNTNSLVNSEAITSSDPAAIGTIKIDSKYIRTCSACGLAAATYSLINDSNNDADEDRQKVIVFMSDGGANRAYENESPNYSEPAPPFWPVNKEEDDDNQAQGRDSLESWGDFSKDEMNITIYSIGFGNLNNVAQNSLKQLASGEEYFFYGTDTNELATIYQNISQTIISATYVSQLVNVTTDYFDELDTKLYDSYLEYTYKPSQEPQIGKIKITKEKTLNDACEQNININLGENTVVGAGIITSYSDKIWTRLAKINDSTIFNMSQYNLSFKLIGDPFFIGIPFGKILKGTNKISLKLNDGETDQESNCNSNNKLIYDVYLPAIFSSPEIKEKAQGCKWNYTYDDTVNAINIPSDYNGDDICNLTHYNADDALQVLGYQIIDSLTHNGELLIDLENSDFEIKTASIDDIPYMWGPAMLGVMIWR
ncbi:MAG: hypothetical protein ACLFN8_00345 [Candidatus Woesearchaeota archaeon]